MIRQRAEGIRRLNRLRRENLDARFPGLLDLAVPQGREVIAAWNREPGGGSGRRMRRADEKGGREGRARRADEGG